MAAGPPVPGNPASPSIHGASDDDVRNLIGITCMLLVLCALAVGGRFKARRMTKAKWGCDDYLTLIALVRPVCGQRLCFKI